MSDNSDQFKGSIFHVPCPLPYSPHADLYESKWQAASNVYLAQMVFSGEFEEEPSWIQQLDNAGGVISQGLSAHSSSYGQNWERLSSVYGQEGSHNSFCDAV